LGNSCWNSASLASSVFTETSINFSSTIGANPLCWLFIISRSFIMVAVASSYILVLIYIATCQWSFETTTSFSFKNIMLLLKDSTWTPVIPVANRSPVTEFF
jgi:hypothetical protein